MCILKTTFPILAGMALIPVPGFPSPGAADIVFPHEWIGDIDEDDFKEPSGICWHEERGTLFVVGDEGHLSEISTEGKELSHDRIRKADFEGITHDPSTGLLYIAVEGDEAVLEVDPDTLKVKREFDLPRSYEGRKVMSKKGQGIEAITFAPDPSHPHGGLFHIANQSFDLTKEDDLSAVFQVELPLRDTKGRVRILDYFEPGIIDLSGLHYDAVSGVLTVISDASNTFHQYDREGRLIRSFAFPAQAQEGITMDHDGFVYVAQDSGGIIKLGPSGD